MGKLWTTLTFFALASAALFESKFWGVTLVLVIQVFFFSFFQPCISLESALIEALDKFTASETLKIMQVSRFMHVIRDTGGHLQGDFAATCNRDKIKCSSLTGTCKRGVLAEEVAPRRPFNHNVHSGNMLRMHLFWLFFPFHEHMRFSSIVVGKVVYNLQ